MKITIWSDYACPYCYIADKRIQNIINELGVENKVQWDIHAFQLYPDAPNEVTETTLNRFAAKYRLTKKEAAQRIDEISNMGRGEGLDFKYATTLNTNTMDAHRLTQWVKDTKSNSQLTKKLADLLFKAYFTDNRKLADHNVLIDVAVQAGLNEDEVTKLLNSNDYEEQVIADEYFIQSNGVHAVPFTIIDGKGYMGAQPNEVFKKAIQEALVKEA